MKPAAFAFERPASRDEVDALLAAHGSAAKVMAGGQSLVPLLSMRLLAPGCIVSLGGLEGEEPEPEGTPGGADRAARAACRGRAVACRGARGPAAA